MAHIPQELIYEILVYLPAKSLLRFKCVQKSFFSTINSKDFINSHMKTSSENRINRSLIYLRMNYDPSFYKFQALHINGGGRFEEDSFMLELKPPQCIYPYAHASCNGLILFTVNLHELAVLNPSTREYKNLPRCPVELTHGATSLNFGYDSSKDDYKILIVKKIIENPYTYHYELWIFGFKSGFWRRTIQDFPYHQYVVLVGGSHFSGDDSLYEGSNCFLDGALHFLFYEYKRSLYKIVAFDVVEENFSIISVPSNSSEIPNQLQVLEGCLSLRFWHHWHRHVNIYVRKKDGDEFTWILLRSVTSISVQYFDCLRSGELLGYSKERDKLLFSYDKNIYSYCLADGNVEEIETMTIYGLISKVYCIDSLVRISDYLDPINDYLELSKTRKKERARRMKNLLFSCIGSSM